MRPIERGLLALAGAGAASWWWITAEVGAPAATVALKALAILPLATIVVGRRRECGPLVGLALIAHSAGDVLLELAPFLAAVAAFGLGHLLYAAAFLRSRRRWEQVGGGEKLGLGALALAGGLVVPRVLAIAPGGTSGPLAAYALALLTMAALAQLADRGRPWVAWGALAYVASDSLLAFHLFGGGLPGGRSLVWPLYWLGQAAIALGWARRADGANAGRAGSLTRSRPDARGRAGGRDRSGPGASGARSGDGDR